MSLYLYDQQRLLIRRRLQCSCVFNIGSAADLENGLGRLVKLKCLNYQRGQIIYPKPNFNCWPNDINSVKLFTWEKITLTKWGQNGRIPKPNFITWDSFFFFAKEKKNPRINYFSCILVTVTVCVVHSSLNAQKLFPL